MYNIKTQNANFEIRTVAEGIFRVRIARGEEFKETLLSKYNILQEPGEVEANVSGNTVSLGTASLEIADDGTMTFSGTKAPVKVTYTGFEGKAYNDKGFTLNLSMTDDERIFGLGDESRENIARRGTFSRLDIRNIASYGPMPYIMSTNGWGLLLNCTYASTIDCGKEDANTITIAAHKGQVDFYFYVAESHDIKDILALNGKIAGTPVLMPKFAYGYTCVLNEQTNAREMLFDCLNFRREDISCDMIGLEPQWMSRHYDRSIDKQWDKERFFIPDWLPENQSGPDTFMYALRQLGFKFSLWLCQDYDLLWEEERQCGRRAEAFGKEYTYEGASILDPHFACPNYMDNLTKRDIPWFDHLKKFCDNGASAFKLDGAFQVNDHPDRLWAGKYFDDEVHNVYPVIYVKQMQEGFTEHTGRRAVIYTPCIYAGTQRYAASWAGDTGGGFDTVIAMLNFGLSGHSNATCDMDVSTIEGVHYGFFTPWVQQLTWRTWNYPWFMRDEIREGIKYYSHLRNSLFPYVYSMAHKAAETSLPLCRALSLMYPDNKEFDYVANTYMFGDSILISVFEHKVTLPEGRWIDYFTGEVYEGGKTIEYHAPAGRGGAMMIKEGSLFCTMASTRYIEEKTPDNYVINVYPGADAEFALYEDDGYTYDYKNGGQAITKMAIAGDENNFSLTVKMREGSFDGRVKREDAPLSDPEIPAMGEVTGFTAKVYGEIKSVELDGNAVDFTVGDDGYSYFNICKCAHEKSDLTYKIVK